MCTYHYKKPKAIYNKCMIYIYMYWVLDHHICLISTQYISIISKFNFYFFFSLRYVINYFDVYNISTVQCSTLFITIVVNLLSN